jgi:2-(1,2-epoxy-1,2-dihydrophenyl)acetyl-CoA isomerase
VEDAVEGAGAGTETGTAPPVECTVTDAVATVRLNRPDAMNSLTRATKEALLATLRAVADDDAVRAVVLTGSGRAFCVGQDLREHVADLRAADGDTAAGGAPGAEAPGAGAPGTGGPEGATGGLGTTVREHYNPITTLLSTMPKPVIAAVNGVAAGAGASFAFACDLRLLGESGAFNLAFAGIGLSCDSGASWWLPRLVGVARAKELLLLPRTVRAPEALDLGLASRVVPDDELAATAAELAGRLAAGPTQAYAAIRRAVAYSQGHDLHSSLEHEAGLMASTGATADHRNAVEAFVAKQPPTFTGS